MIRVYYGEGVALDPLGRNLLIRPCVLWNVERSLVSSYELLLLNILWPHHLIWEKMHLRWVLGLYQKTSWVLLHLRLNLEVLRSIWYNKSSGKGLLLAHWYVLRLIMALRNWAPLNSYTRWHLVQVLRNLILAVHRDWLS